MYTRDVYLYRTGAEQFRLFAHSLNKRTKNYIHRTLLSILHLHFLPQMQSPPSSTRLIYLRPCSITILLLLLACANCPELQSALLRCLFSNRWPRWVAHRQFSKTSSPSLFANCHHHRHVLLCPDYGRQSRTGLGFSQTIPRPRKSTRAHPGHCA